MKKFSIAFFDVDHTLTRRSTGFWIAIGAVHRGLVPLWSLFSLPFYYLWYRFGPQVYRNVNSQHLPTEVSVLRGLEKSALQELSAHCFSRHIDSELYEDARKLISSMRRSGTQIVLATTSLDFIIEPLAKNLGAHAVIANSLEFIDGRTTGKFNGDLIFGQGKYDACLNFARSREVGLSDCAFYSDSIHDLPLLLSVGKPIAVNPDWRLRRYAKKVGWEILEFSRR